MKALQPLVSITLSAYNVENFIYESLNCIVNQTLKDIEIICFDDCSTDGTLQIIKSYALKDLRIRVVAKTKNGGLAVARNEALQLAKGKYVTFLDGDDLYDIEMIEKAYNLAELEQSDVVIWDYQVFYKPFELKGVNLKESNLKNLDANDKIALLQLPAFTGVKLLKTEKVKELGIHFPIGRTRQDIPVHWHLITAIDRISILPEKLVFYRQQSGATTSQKDRRLFDLAYVLDVVKDNLMADNLYNRYKNEFLRQRLNLLFGMYDSVKKEYKVEALEIMNNRLSTEEWKYIYSTKSLRFQARWFFKANNGSIVPKIKLNIWLLARNIYRGLKR